LPEVRLPPPRPRCGAPGGCANQHQWDHPRGIVNAIGVPEGSPNATTLPFASAPGVPVRQPGWTACVRRHRWYSGGSTTAWGATRGLTAGSRRIGASTVASLPHRATRWSPVPECNADLGHRCPKAGWPVRSRSGACLEGCSIEAMPNVLPKQRIQPRALVQARVPGRPGDAQIPEDLHITDIAGETPASASRRVACRNELTPAGVGTRLG
jgi:hypothetical protein